MKKSAVKNPEEKTKSAYPAHNETSREKIRERAYEIFLERDPDEGSAEEDWLNAEDELYSDPGI